MWNKLRDWYLAIIGIIVIAGGLYFASHTGSSDGAAKEQSKQTQSVSSSTEAAKAPGAPDRSSVQASPPTEAAATKVPPAPVASNAPPTAAQNDPAAHNHAAANVPQTNIAQAPAAAPAPAPTAASQTGPSAGATPIAGGDPAAGKLVFRKCQVCHSLEPGKNVLGPSLAGIVGRKSGEEPNYAYSPAMKSANLSWDAKTLDAYLDDPQKFIPGNRMPFPGLKTTQDRTDVIAFLAAPAGSPVAQPSRPAAAAQPSGAQAQPNAPAPIAAYVPDARYTLRSGIAYLLGGTISKPLEGIQTVSVAPGGAVIVDFKLQVPGNYTIVDHALTRLERGLVGILSVEGSPNLDIYNGQVMSGMRH